MAVPKMIEKNMEVVGRDGAHVGFVDQEHYIPLDWLVHAQIKVHLKLNGDEAKARWTTH